MKKIYLVNYFNWSDSDYEATLNDKHVEEFDKSDYIALEFHDENQFIFFLTSSSMILFKTVKIFNTLQELTSYFEPLFYSGSLTEKTFFVATIKQLLDRKISDI